MSKLFKGQKLVGVNDNSLSGLPVGSLVQLLTVNAPAGYLAPDGAAKRRDVYSALWSFIQSSGLMVTEAEWQSDYTANGGACGYFSDGDGTTTFRMPALGGMVIRANVTGQAIDVSRIPGSYQADAVKAHTHTYNDYSGTDNVSTVASDLGAYSVSNTSSTGGAENLVKNVSYNLYIKAIDNVAGSSGNIAEVTYTAVAATKFMLPAISELNDRNKVTLVYSNADTSGYIVPDGTDKIMSLNKAMQFYDATETIRDVVLQANNTLKSWIIVGGCNPLQHVDTVPGSGLAEVTVEL